jgi:hypothetical protein
MKRFIVILLLLLAAGVCIAVSFISGTELIAAPPARSLPEAYAMALRALGSATNGSYCVSASRSHDWCYAGEWVFRFDRNHLDHSLVFVAMKPYEEFNPHQHLMPWPLIEVREIFGSSTISTNRFWGK